MPSARTPDDFGTAFTALLTAAELSVDQVVARCRKLVSRSTLYAWRKGEHLPEDIGPLVAVVELCLTFAAQRGADLSAVPSGVEGWLRLLAEAKQVRDSRSGYSSSSGRSSRTVEVGSAGAGRLISQWDPVVLGVHKAIGGGPLPPYVRRTHDQLLYVVLDPAPAGNRLVVLRGDSSTGKSRAAYQAVMARLSNWSVFFPRTTVALSRLLDMGVAPRSVLWLNELRHYADDPAGSQTLFDLAELLTGRDHVAVITSVWPEHWAAYTASQQDGPGAADLARAIQELLIPLPELTGQNPRQIDASRGGVIDVPRDVTEGELARARHHGDPVLDEAIDAAKRAGSPGRLIQYLAGVPDLLTHYEGPGADPYGQALITAATDAARLQHSPPFKREFLQEAAIGYLAPQHRAIHSDDPAAWQEPAWAYATRTLKGAIQALEPVPPEQGTGVAGYRLADYLEQHTRQSRCLKVPPETFWMAAAKHARTPQDIADLANAAHARWRDRIATMLYRQASAAGNTWAILGLARVWQEAGDLAEAERLNQMVLDLEKAYRASPKVESAAERVETKRLALDAAVARRFMLQIREEAGDHVEAERLAREATDNGAALRLLASIRHDAGHDSDAERLYQLAADAGSTWSMTALAWNREQTGDRIEVERLYQQAIDSGSTSAMLDLARMREETGDRADAERLYRKAADAGSVDALACLARLQEKDGNHLEAERLACQAASMNIGDTGALATLARMRDAAGDHAEVERLARLAADVNVRDGRPLLQLARMREEAGDHDEAKQFYQMVVDTGDVWTIGNLVQQREKAGDWAEAERLARLVADGGHSSPLKDLARRRQNEPEWRRMLQYGLESDGSTSYPW
jgi:tetratricopeptide (TPR) repeat protein